MVTDYVVDVSFQIVLIYIFIFCLAGVVVFSYPVRLFLRLTGCDHRISISLQQQYKKSGRTLGVPIKMGRNDDVMLQQQKRDRIMVPGMYLLEIPIITTRYSYVVCTVPGIVPGVQLKTNY